MSESDPVSHTLGIQSRGGKIVSRIFDTYTPADYVRSFRQLADDIESGRVKINSLVVTKAGKGNPTWSVAINLDDLGKQS